MIDVFNQVQICIIVASYYFIYKVLTIKVYKEDKNTDKKVVLFLGALLILYLVIYHYFPWEYEYGIRRYMPDNKEYFIVMLIFTFMLYRKSKGLSKTVYYAVYGYILIQIAQEFFDFLNNMIYEAGHIMSMEETILLSLMQPCMLFLFYRVMKKRREEFELDVEDWNVFAVLAILVCLYFYLFESYIPNIDPNKSKYYMNIILCFIIAIYLLFGRYQHILMKKSKSLLQTKLQLQSKQYQEQLREELMQANDENRKLRHDLKQHFAILESAVKDDPEYALNYIKELWDHVETVKYAATGNDILNYVLDTKSAAASKHAVTFTYMIEDDLSFMNDFDLITILGNLLDNALEAQAFVEDKWVNMKIARDRDIVNISVENACDQRRILRQGDNLETSKKDKECHGLGIKNVKECCEKYEGCLQTELEEGVFKATVTMMMQK